MARHPVVAATVSLAGILMAAMPAVAKSAPPLLPTALVEDVSSATADVEFMDYVGAGQTITLGAKDVVVLSYLRSCEHEVITGGTVKVGFDKSEVTGGQVVRSRVACDGGKVQLTSAQASQSGASAFRVQSADVQRSADEPTTLFARSPVIRLPDDTTSGTRTLVIQRTDRRARPMQVKLDDKAGAVYDLAKINVRLVRGAAYQASVGSHTTTFRIDRKAKSGPAPVISRLVRFH